MTCGDIIKYIESWAPGEIAWDNDNVGLQVGSAKWKIKNILLSLDLNIKVLNEAIKKNCNLIINHHPIFYNPLKNISLDKGYNALLIEKLIRNNISVYAAHTNLDFTRDGVSFQLAKALKLKNIRFLKNLRSAQLKLAVFVPESHLESVAESVFENGGGIIGEYTHCSFRTKGEGSFKGSSKTSPSVGKKLNYEKVPEIKLEVLIDSWKLEKILNAVKKVHPYEEIAFDVYPVTNENINYGMGAVGELTAPMGKNEFLKHVSGSLKLRNFRYTKGSAATIKKVAVCGGSGSELIKEAVKAGADSYITADLKYHTFFENETRLLLIDAGHFETEVVILDELKKRLSDLTGPEKIKIFKYSKSANPVIFYNNLRS